MQRSPEGGAVLRVNGRGRTRLTPTGQAELTDRLRLALGEDSVRPDPDPDSTTDDGDGEHL
ncbi:VWA domain-containing protein [Streptomyces californicus]